LLGSVVIGADPHKLSVTIEVLDGRERVLHQGRYGTDRDGYRQMLSAARQFERRSWAVEGCNGIGRHVAQRLVADGETVVDVPAKLAARARLFDTGNGRKTDPADAHSVAVVALRTRSLTQVRVDDELVALRLLADRRDELGRSRTQTVNRLCRYRHSRFYGDRAVISPARCPLEPVDQSVKNFDLFSSEGIITSDAPRSSGSHPWIKA